MVRWKEKVGTLARKVSWKDSLFIPQTSTWCMVLPSATEQMAQGNRFTRTLSNWRVPCSLQMTNRWLLYTPICCDLETRYFLWIPSIGKWITTNFSFCQQELRKNYAPLTQAAPIAFRIWPEAQLYFSSLCHSTWTVQFVSLLSLAFENIQKILAQWNQPSMFFKNNFEHDP